MDKEQKIYHCEITEANIRIRNKTPEIVMYLTITCETTIRNQKWIFPMNDENINSLFAFLDTERFDEIIENIPISCDACVSNGKTTLRGKAGEWKLYKDGNLRISVSVPKKLMV